MNRSKAEILRHRRSDSSTSCVDAECLMRRMKLRGMTIQELMYATCLDRLSATPWLTDKVYLLAADILKKLAYVPLPLGELFTVGLAGLAHTLSGSVVGELVTLRSTYMLGLSSGSMAGAVILRVLEALSGLSLNVNKGEEVGGKIEDQSVFSNLNVILEQLWQELSDYITTTEMKLGHTQNFASSVRVPDSGDIVGGNTSLGTYRLLPFIEAFFVLCEKYKLAKPFC